MKSGAHSLEEDSLILRVSRDYLAELEAGRQPDRAAYLARYPGLAELAEYLEGVELAHTLRPTTGASPASSDASASPLGDFQIVREIGRGGMGVVYEATQLSLGRKVALKVLPFAAALDVKHLQRFKTEAQAAAQLHHTNIVPVYAIGCERGLHFYAMQLIEGRSLSEIIDELRTARDQGAPSRFKTRTTAAMRRQSTVSMSAASQHSGRTKASFRAVAQMAAQVADALEYAHDAGVVHRDIKPANLLLDAKGAVWITDFGLALVAADANLTQTGELVGTLRYMSPEQAAGRNASVDYRTDIYSLGVTLYELLTLKPIFSGNDRVTLLHQVLNEDPVPLRKWDRAIPIELETIVLKALAKRPVERYATAGELAADLRRFLDERPILARRPTLVDRVRKWGRRHPSFVAAGVLLLACGMIGLAITTAIVAREHAATKDAYERESQRAREAEARFQLARRAADEMIYLAEEELSDVPFQQGLRKRLLEAALNYYQEFIDQRSEDPTAQADLELTRDRVRRILADLQAVQAERNNFLLKVSGVLDDIGATPEQRARLAEWSERAGERRRANFSYSRATSHEQRQQRWVEMARLNEQELAAILTPAQLQRLRQIALQWQGPSALRELNVANALKLSPEQKSRIRVIEDRYTERGERSGYGGDPRPQHSRDQRFRTALEEVRNVLTPEQRERWLQMTGRPYEGPLSYPSREGRSGSSSSATGAER
jgi:hypothetical protein